MMESEDVLLDISKLKFSGDFDQQLSEVVEYIHLKRDDVERLNELITDLYQVFTPAWKDIEVLGFGSIVTGLGLRTSDVDCYIHLPRRLHPPDKAFVLGARNILTKHSYLFQNAFAIVHANVPIVKFYHVPTSMHCDLSFKSPAAVANSRLLAYLLNTNRKILQLAILVKYWSKIHNLTGTNLMSSYSLTLLVIFFFQQINMLCSVMELQENVEESFIDGWNTAFRALDDSIANDSKVMYELLGEFFKYYKNFEFDKNIVCPYLGKPVRRELFAKLENVPVHFSLYKKNLCVNKFKSLRLDSVWCIQDPFEHNRNSSVAVHPKLAQRIKDQFHRAALIYENNDERIFLKSLLQRCSDENIPVEKSRKRRPPRNGVRKTFKRNPDFKLFNFKQNNDRWRNQYTWRGNGNKLGN